ncbi:LamG domain-containing protein [Candidatus Poribacteria bacterium]|nr:LamG domain-containing protein [Candidatus Poribacteria bacterium]
MKMFMSIILVSILCLMFFSYNSSANIVTDGLVSYWTFDQKDIEGKSVKDVWGKNNGTIVGAPNVVEGKVGDALEFDGSDDYVNLTNLGDYGEKIGKSTFEAWVKTSFSDDWTSLFKVLDDGCNMAWAIDVNRSAKAGFPLAKDIVHFYIRQNAAAGCNDIAVEIEYGLSDGKWHHIVFAVEDAAEAKISAYIDSEVQEIIVGKEKNLEEFISFVRPVYIGAANNRGKVERHFPGLIDEVRIYDRPLTAGEVTQNFRSKVGLSVEAIEKLTTIWGTLKSEI